MVLLGKARKKIWQTHYFFMSFLVSTTSPFSSKCQGIGKKHKSGFVITRDDRRRLRCWNFRTISGARNRNRVIVSATASIYKRLRSPGIDSASLCSLAGLCTINQVVAPAHQAGNRILGTCKGLQIRPPGYRVAESIPGLPESLTRYELEFLKNLWGLGTE